jgi:hypothetical protein
MAESLLHLPFGDLCLSSFHFTTSLTSLWARVGACKVDTVKHIQKSQSALFRARRRNAPTILGAHTPSCSAGHEGTRSKAELFPTQLTCTETPSSPMNSLVIGVLASLVPVGRIWRERPGAPAGFRGHGQTRGASQGYLDHPAALRPRPPVAPPLRRWTTTGGAEL